MFELVVIVALAALTYAHVHLHMSFKQIRDDVVAEVRKVTGGKP